MFDSLQKKTKRSVGMMETRKKTYLAIGTSVTVLVMIVVLGLIPVYTTKMAKPYQEEASTTTVASTSTRSFPSDSMNTTSITNVRLANFDELSFNDATSNFRILLDYPILDTGNYTVLINGEVALNTTSSDDSITIYELLNSSSVISVFALDKYGLPIFASFQIYSGSLTMAVRMFFPNGSIAIGVTVNLTLTDNPRVTQTGVTDGNGTVVFVHVPSLTISIFARTNDNQIGLAGIAPSNTTISLTLIPFNGGTTRTNELQNQSYVNVTTAGQTLQTISRIFITASTSTEVYVEYKFITSEVPGGFFGSRFNDYFSVTLRSETGKYVTRVDSMNGLGLGAFNYATGETRWYNITMKVGSSPEQIRFDVGVSNVGDAAYQSSVLVRSYGSIQCIGCESECVQCTSDPMCREICKSPPIQSCAFYTDCMEEKVSCGSNSYALKYGRKNCIKFSNMVNKFTPFGQTWIWQTMHCLQKALVIPLKDCQANCSSLSETAFNSHPQCYIDNGFCNVSAYDMAHVITTVGKDLLTRNGFVQAIKTESQCIPIILSRIQQELQKQIATQYKILFMILKTWFQLL